MPTVSLSPVGNDEQYFTKQGVVAGGGFKLFTYVAGSVNTPTATYTDITGATPNANPIILDSAGHPPQEIWIPNGVQVKFVLQDQTGVVQWTKDFIPGINDPFSLTGVSAAMTPVVTAPTVDAARSLLGIPGQNLLIGDMQVWQRTVALFNPTTANFYACDRWGFNRSGDAAGATISKTLYPGAGVSSGVYWQRTPGDASTASMFAFYTWESQDAAEMRGQTVTFSINLSSALNYSGGSVNINVYYGTGTDQRVYLFTGQALAGAATVSPVGRPSVVASIPANATEVGIQLSWTPTGTAGVNDGLVMYAPKMEFGSVATPFVARPFAQELALCQRYAEPISFATGYQSNTAGVTASGTWDLAGALAVRKRSTPTLTLYPGNTSVALVTGVGNSQSATPLTSWSTFNTSASIFRGRLTATIAGSANTSGTAISAVTTQDWLLADAEL